MNILITNIQLTVPGGTVSYVADLATGLKKRGFGVEVFTFKIGTIGLDLKEAGINVVTNLRNLKTIPDIIHAHHHPTAMQVLMKFSNTPVIFFLHDSTSPFDKPIKNRHILKHVAVDYNCLDRLIIRENIEAHFTKVIYNWVDTDKFKLRTTFNEKPANALVFSNYATKNNHYKIIEAACKRAGLPLDVLGEGMGNAVKKPEDIIGNYDLVFAKAKAAIEALATGAGVIVCDYAGFGEIVGPANFNYLKKFNFGRRTLTRSYEEAIILEEINKFNSADNRQNALTIRDQSSFDKILEEIILLYKETVRDYADGKRGPKEHLVKTWLIAAALKNYYFFSTTILFKKLSAFKYKIINKLQHSL